jgi:hypothetical protein
MTEHRRKKVRKDVSQKEGRKNMEGNRGGGGALGRQGQRGLIDRYPHKSGIIKRRRRVIT